MMFKSRKELYQFRHGERYWYFTSDSKKVMHNGIEYLPVRGLSRGNIEDADIDKAEVDIIFPHPYALLNKDNEEFTQVFLNKIYFESVYLTIFELYRDTTLVLYKGRVTQPKFDDSANTMTLVCSTAETYQNRNILTRKFQRTCPNKIYDRFCGLVFADWAVEVTVTAINGLDVSYTVNPTQVIDAQGNPVFEPDIVVLDEDGNPALDENGLPIIKQGAPVMEIKSYLQGYFTRGLLKKGGVFTFIRENSGGVRLYRQHIGLKVGDVVLLAPGCDQSLKVCDSVFHNSRNYHGFPNIPNENPVNNQILK